MKKRILNPLAMAVIGGGLGLVCKWMDIWGWALGDVFSQLPVWILLGTLISLYSPTPYRAMGNLLPFCLGMLLAYYVTAALSHSVYGWALIKGWTIFALTSPMLAFLVWRVWEPGTVSRLIGLGVQLVCLGWPLVVSGFRLSDWIINGALCYFLFFRRKDRKHPTTFKENGK